MATQDKTSWDVQEKSMGEVGDQQAQCPQGGREAVQKRTFTRWMNVSLQRCEPPVEVHDLYTDIQDGRVLMALLEELSGCKLVYRFRPSSHRIFRLNNIAKVLAFLDDRHVKLLGIDASCIADGIPSVVLNLVWKIILYFQIKELTGGLERPFSSSLSSLSMSSYPSASDLSPLSSHNRSFSSSTLPTKGRRASRTPKYHGKVIKTLLHWVQRCTSKFGVEVHDFGKSWMSGLAFLAMIKSIDPALVDLKDGLSREPRENVQEAFMIAQHSLGIPPLLEPEDVTCTSPDERSIITYVSMFLEHYSGVDEDDTTDIEMRINIPEIPSFTSPESMSFGETLTHQPEAQALIKGLEKTNEQLLWKRWARRCSGEPHATSLYMSNTNNIFSSYNPPNGIEQTVGDTTASQYDKDKPISVVKPISPLDIDNVDLETRSWMEKATVYQVYSKSMNEGHFSQSSEEGIYSLSALDSDEEDAYSYILDLNKEVFQSYSQLNGQAPRVEEGTVEGKISNRQMTRESKHLNASEVLTENGAECYSRHQESLLALNGDFDRVQPKDQGNIDVEENRNSVRDEQQKIRETNRLRETVNGREMCDVEEKSEDEGRSEDEFEEGREGVAREENNDGDDEEEENAEFLEDAGLEKEVEAEIVGQVEKEGEERKAGKQEEREEEEELENGVKKEEEHSVVDSQSFKVENQKIFIDESACKVRETAAVRVSTEGEEDRSGNVAPMEEVTKVEEEEGLQKDHKDEGEEEDNFEEVVTVEEKAEEQQNKKHNPLTERGTRIGHPTEMTLEESMKADVNLHDDGKNNACSSTSKSSSSEGGVILQSLAASGELTPLELELLSVLWILLYCYFILPQMNL